MGMLMLAWYAKVAAMLIFPGKQSNRKGMPRVTTSGCNIMNVSFTLDVENKHWGLREAGLFR